MIGAYVIQPRNNSTTVLGYHEIPDQCPTSTNQEFHQYIQVMSISIWVFFSFQMFPSPEIDEARSIAFNWSRANLVWKFFKPDLLFRTRGYPVLQKCHRSYDRCRRIKRGLNRERSTSPFLQKDRNCDEKWKKTALGFFFSKWKAGAS